MIRKGGVMRIQTIFLSVIFIGLTSLTVMVSKAPAHEEYLLGTWQETRWHYEKPDSTTSEKSYHMGGQDEVSGEAYRIHLAETWTFEKDGVLKLWCKGECITARWSIKGRGHILQIKYSDNYTESYQLSELEKNQMTLNYESDAQAKGIAQLSFKKMEG